MDETVGLFITGTDTDVGKTLITCAFTRLLRQQGLDAVAFKPMASGEVAGSWGDATALHSASGRVEPIEKICPLRFAVPIAPLLAARKEGIEPSMSLPRSVLSHLMERHAAVLIEGAGGLMVPLDADTLVLDFAVQCGFPVLVVCRAALGTINHTVLTLRELERAHCRIAGVIMNCTQPGDALIATGAAEEIERISGHRVLAIIPYLAGSGTSGTQAAIDASPEAPQAARVARCIAALTEQQVNVGALLKTEKATPSIKRS